MFEYEDEFNSGGYDGFGRDDDYNIWEENQLAGENEDPAEDSYLDTLWEDQYETSLGWWGD